MTPKKGDTPEPDQVETGSTGHQPEAGPWVQSAQGQRLLELMSRAHAIGGQQAIDLVHAAFVLGAERERDLFRPL